jgi:aldehyde:ferredoxin oxidoreductase
MIQAEGAKTAAEKIGKGSLNYAMHAKGLPLPIHEPRGKAGLALVYSVSPTGADHIGGKLEKLGLGWAKQ